VPLLGLVRRDASITIASRHLGLVQAEEHADLAKKIARAGELVAQGCDLDAIMQFAAHPPPPCGEGLGEGPLQRARPDTGQRHSILPRHYPSPAPSPQGGGELLAPLGQRIAVARDVAFAFVYPHLLQDWQEAGAEIFFFSPLADQAPGADADAVYLPGGYPELHAGRIAVAEEFRAGVHAAVTRGALIYGECGGYMMLGDTLTDKDGHPHRMLGLLPVSTSFERPKLHLGYRRLMPIGGLPWAAPLNAHEFHFAGIISEAAGERLFEGKDAAGEKLGPIGLRRGRVMGSFAHVIDAA
jgi:cobyrinic acid a,c-diamide synthase